LWSFGEDGGMMHEHRDECHGKEGTSLCVDISAYTEIICKSELLTGHSGHSFITGIICTTLYVNCTNVLFLSVHNSAVFLYPYQYLSVYN